MVTTSQKGGLLCDLNHRAYRVKEVRFVDGNGRRVGGFGVDVFRKMTSGRYISLPRSSLGEVIYRTIESRCEIVFGDSVSEVENTPDGVTVRFERSPQRKFDLVVGADGLHSAVRRVVFGPESQFERYLGYAVAAFEAKGYRPQDEGVFVSYGLPGKQASRFPLRDDRTRFLLVFHAPKHHLADLRDLQAQKALLHREFDCAGWECAQILSALDRAEASFYSIRSARFEWTVGRAAAWRSWGI